MATPSALPPSTPASPSGSRRATGSSISATAWATALIQPRCSTLIVAFRRAFLAQPLTFLGDFVVLRGSQEEMWHKLLELQFAPNPREVLPWMLDHGVAATLEAYGVDAKAGVAACRDSITAITRWTGIGAGRGRSAAGPPSAFGGAAPRRLYRGGRRCCSSMPGSTRGSRSSCSATCSGGAAAAIF